MLMYSGVFFALVDNSYIIMGILEILMVCSLSYMLVMCVINWEAGTSV